MMLYPADRTTTVIISCRQLFSPKKACLNDMPLISCFSVKPLNCFFQTGSIKYSQSAPMHHHHLHHQFLGFFFFFKKSLADRGYLSHSRVLSSVVSYPLQTFTLKLGGADFRGVISFSFSRTGEPLAWRIFMFLLQLFTPKRSFLINPRLCIRGCIFRLLLK